MTQKQRADGRRAQQGQQRHAGKLPVCNFVTDRAVGQCSLGELVALCGAIAASKEYRGSWTGQREKQEIEQKDVKAGSKPSGDVQAGKTEARRQEQDASRVRLVTIYQYFESEKQSCAQG